MSAKIQKFLKDALNENLNKDDGPNSTKLFDDLQLTVNQKTGKNNAAKFRGVKILILKNGKYEYSKNEAAKIQSTIRDFLDILGKAKIEHVEPLRVG